MRLSREYTALLTLVRASLWQREIDTQEFPKLDEKSWREVVKLSVKHGVRAIAWEVAKSLPKGLQPPLQLKVEWAVGAEQIEKNYLNQLAVYQKIRAKAEEAGCTMLILKGLAHSSYYPIPSQRECGDIDIYPLDFERAVEVISSIPHIKGSEESKHDHYNIDGVEIELHHRILHDLKICRDVDLFLQHRLVNEPPQNITLYDNAMLTMGSPTFSILHMYRHIAGHIYSNVALRQLCDWAMLLSKHHAEIDRAVVIPELRRLRVLEFAAAISECAINILGMDRNCNIFEGCGATRTVRMLERRFTEKIFVINDSDKIAKKGWYDLAKRVDITRDQMWIERYAFNKSTLELLRHKGRRFIELYVKKG